MLKVVHSDDAPEAIGPYSQAILVEPGRAYLFMSGQIGLKPDGSGEMIDGGINGQTLMILSNASSVWKAAGARKEDVVSATIFLYDLDDFVEVNRIYGEYFGQHKPARTTVEVSALPKGALIEISFIVAIPAPPSLEGNSAVA